MGLRNRNGKWHYKFHAAGRTWTGDTSLVATERNRSAALMAEAEARKLVTDGRGDRLRLTIKPFSDAADQFIEWAKGEYRTKPNTWKRLRGSLTSLKKYFGNLPLHSITVGQVQDYMSWRRSGDEARDIAPVKEITLRHDLHALSPLFQYGQKHNWCSHNPVESVKIPSDKDAQRIHVVTAAEEALYFATCEHLEREQLARAASVKRKGSYVRAARSFRALHDLAKTMLLQGTRPSEAMQAHRAHVDIEAGKWQIPESKSNAGRRTLRLLPETRSIFAARIAESSRGWIFEGKSVDAPMKDAENAHKKVLDRSRLAFVLYDFRHTAATRWAERGMGVETIAKLLGHANLRTVMRYIHLSQEHLDRSILLYGSAAEPNQVKVQSGSNGTGIFDDSSPVTMSQSKVQ
jgi:integrase